MLVVERWDFLVWFMVGVTVLFLLFGWLLVVFRFVSSVVL